MSKIIEVSNLTHTYSGTSAVKRDAVKNVSFSLSAGEILGIIGHTGSGKSTLVQHLNGLLKPTDGTVLVDGENIWAKSKKIRKIRFDVGLVFQYPEYQLFEETVFLDIAYGPKNMGVSGNELNERVIETCDLLNISREYLQKSPFDLSGGEKRRVAIAGVMAMRPKVIVLDEPIAGLDPKGRADVLKMIESYSKAFNATIIIISHNMEDMALLADKLLVMNKGEIAMFGKTEEIFLRGDELREIGLNVPIVTRVISVLRAKGVDVPEDIFTVESAVKYLCNMERSGAK